jgi:hypothetical protein
MKKHKLIDNKVVFEKQGCFPRSLLGYVQWAGILINPLEI